MIMHQKELIQWDLVQQRKRQQQISDNKRENKKRTKYVYKPGDSVLIVKRKCERTGKLVNFKNQGPYKVLRTFGNGTVEIQRRNFKETISILRLKLFRT